MASWKIWPRSLHNCSTTNQKYGLSKAGTGVPCRKFSLASGCKRWRQGHQSRHNRIQVSKQQKQCARRLWQPTFQILKFRRWCSVHLQDPFLFLFKRENIILSQQLTTTCHELSQNKNTVPARYDVACCVCEEGAVRMHCRADPHSRSGCEVDEHRFHC